MYTRRLCLAVVLVLGLVAAGPATGAAGGSTHTWHVSLVGPAQFDLTFAELRFKGPGTPTLRLALTRPAGLYFVAGALVRRPSSGGPRALVVVVNRRPRGSLAPDRATIGLHVTEATELGAPSAVQVADPFNRPVGSTSTKRLCGLANGHGASDLRAVLSAGGGLPGFPGAAAVAEAYDVACGLPYDPAFGRAVTGCSTNFAAGCCPANAMCAIPAPGPPPMPAPTPGPSPTPTPTPTPTPIPPGCGCPPPPRCAPGYACPLAATRDFTRAIACPLAASAAIVCYQ